MPSLEVFDEKGLFMLYKAKRRLESVFWPYLSDILSFRFEISCVKQGDSTFIDQVSSQRLKCSGRPQWAKIGQFFNVVRFE